MPQIRSKAVRGALVELTERLRLRFGERLRWVRLFGSWARMEATENSDVDVAIVIDALDPAEWRDVIGIASDIAIAHDLPLTPFAVSSERFDELLRKRRGIAHDILEQGLIA